VSRALTVSSDVFFYTMGANFWIERERFGENAIQDQAAKYGFGTQTGIPLPFESSGRVLTKASKQALHDKNPKLASPGWYTGDNVNLGIGQAVMAVTPIQLADAYVTFANGGTRYSPNVALRVQHSNGKLVREIAPRVVDHLEYPPQVHDPILAGLIGAVSDEKGTAFNAFLGFPLAQWGVAGKTGTAQATPKQDTALFVGFGPVAAPQYVVAVVMEQAGFGATAAAPAARKVFGVLSGLEQQEPPVQFVQQTQPGD
jgi:penicillin-binding protein 2